MSLFPHQQQFLDKKLSKALLVHEAGTGKTRTASHWLKGRDGDALVICPKRVLEKWHEELKMADTKATVLTKEQFKKTAIKQWSAIIVDEADELASPLFIAKNRSQISEHFYKTKLENMDTPILLATATPVRSSPANLHTLLWFLGVQIPWKKWQARFYTLERRPYLPRPAWFPVAGWQEMMQPILEKYADIVLMRDCVSYLPEEEHTEIELVSTPFEPVEWEPMARFVEEHRHEQIGKIAEIKNIAKGYRKIFIVAHYVEQIKELEKELSKDRKTFVIHGSIKDQEAIIKQANETHECYFICQASLGAGFDADSFSCVVFASMSYRVRDYVQMKARVKRIHNLHPVKYYYLFAGRCDKRIYNTIQKGLDFVPSEWMQEYATPQKTK